MASRTSLPATEMARQVREGKLSPVDLLEAHLDRIERLNPALNALIALDTDRARAAARKAAQAVDQGAALGPLHGVPITIKSSIAVAGLPCETGTALRRGSIADHDATLVARLRSAGAIVLGNTNVPEFLMAYETDNTLYGRTNSPWDLERTPGGSSGGEAAAIASGCAAAGVGSDGGGSIRVPAHFSGICGLKPTPGRIPSTGHFPPSQGPFALLGVVGPMTRTVADLKLLFEVMAGPDYADACSAPVSLRWRSAQGLRGLRIGYFADDGRTPVTPATAGAVERAAEALQNAGFRAEPYRPEGLERARAVWDMFFGWGGKLILGPLMKGRETTLPILDEFMKSVGNQPVPTADAFLQAWMERDEVRVNFLAQMEKFPVLVCPVASIPAFRHAERTWTLNGQTVRYLDAMSYSQWFNVLGNPVVVVPVGRSPEGLPIGVQVVGRPFEEEVVLAIAEQIENACGSPQPPPPFGL